MKATGQSDRQYLYAVIACTEPREFTAAELRDLKIDSLPDPWISYTFRKGCETMVQLDKSSFAKNQAYSRFILVQVDDYWLAAQVPPNGPNWLWWAFLASLLAASVAAAMSIGWRQR